MIIINNLLHILAAIVWIGGMIYNTIILFPGLAAIIPQERGKLMGTIAKRFTYVSWISVIILLITGLIRVPYHFILNFNTHYGIFLSIKLIIFILMIIIGLTITFRISLKLKRLLPLPDQSPSTEFIKAQKKLKILGTINMILGILIVLCVILMRTPF